MGIVKLLFRKADASGKDWDVALLEYRNTPISGLQYSPAQLLMSRRLKDKVPSAAKLLHPAVVHHAPQILRTSQMKQEQFYNQRAKPLKSHEVGDAVRVRLGNTWEKAVVTGVHPTPRSYIVTMEDGQELRRNQRFLNPSSHQPRINGTVPDFSPDLPVAAPTLTQREQTPTGMGTVPGPITIPDNVPMPIENPRRSSRITKKPFRLIEEC